jgi:NADH-quinone oxidoreductase subunit A
MSSNKLKMSLSDYLPVLLQILLALGMGVGILGASHLFGQKARRSKIKDSPYECGLAAEVGGETRYSVKFYITAMLFILFDIDVVFLIPWVLTHRDLIAAGVPVLGPMMFFTLVLVIGLVYELKSGALKWEK